MAGFVDFLPHYTKTFQRIYLIVSESMWKRWKRKRAQYDNLELTLEAKRRVFSLNAEQEAGVLSADATEQRVFVPPAQRELTEGGREVSISKCVLRQNMEVLQKVERLCECF